MTFRISNNFNNFLKYQNVINSIKPIPIFINPELQDLDNTFKQLEKTLQITLLYQSDFTNGTYRIKNSGYYKLSENIIFNPNPSIWNGTKLIGDDWFPTYSQTLGGANAIYPIAPYGPYHLGFFTAITVESHNVVIDLNSFTISQSPEHYLQQRFFSVIELASSPFIPTQGPSNFGSPVLYSNYVKIKNGNIGLSSHEGIHGNGMSNIILENLNISNYEQAGIALNGVTNLILRNICIGKSSHNVCIKATYSHSRFIKSFLQSIINNGNPSIIIQNQSISGSQILSNLITSMDQVYKEIIINKILPTNSLYRNDLQLIDGAIYGLVLNVLGVVVNGFLTSLSNTSGNKNILIQNLDICNLNSAPFEVIGLSTNTTSTYGMPVQKGPVGDVFRITEVTNENNYYLPNILANAQCYVSKFKSLISSAGSSNIDSDIYNTWISSQNTPLTPLIDGHNYFICGGDSMAHVMKGNIGIFLSGTQDINMYNININNLQNNGNLGEVEKCSPNTSIYEGNRCRGIAVVVNKNLYIKGLNIDTIISKTADSIGIDFINLSDFVTIENYNILNIEQSNFLNSGIFPNVSSNSILINNKKNVTNLILNKIA
jgi:hypothetical protein